ncbi:hypothetical protein BS78_05G226500 [Paspalum vaginatum]|nr:hypothetical protein BS78_05G226500 [Paspalum vaginatum]
MQKRRGAGLIGCSGKITGEPTGLPQPGHSAPAYLPPSLPNVIPCCSCCAAFFIQIMPPPSTCGGDMTARRGCPLSKSNYTSSSCSLPIPSWISCLAPSSLSQPLCLGDRTQWKK